VEEAGPDDLAEQERLFAAHRGPGVFLHARSLPREVKSDADVRHVRLPFVGPELIAALRDAGAVDAPDFELGFALPQELLHIAGMTPAPSARGRVVVVEDNPVNQRIAKKLVENLGYTVELHSNGLAVVTDLCQPDADRHVTAVLMDLQMPVMDGLEATRQLRAFEARHPRLEPLNIVAMTANTAKEDRDACIYAGMDGFLGKPVARAELLRVLNGRDDSRVGARDSA
jgi:CheY-like chemotaxis protein